MAETMGKSVKELENILRHRYALVDLNNTIRKRVRELQKLFNKEKERKGEPTFPFGKVIHTFGLLDNGYEYRWEEIALEKIATEP